MYKIDSRTGSKELVPYLHVPCELCRLDYADAALVGEGPRHPVHVGIERKTVQDLVNSMQTGRLAGHQLQGLLRCYNYVYLLVEGDWRPSKEGVLELPRRGKWIPFYYSSRIVMYRDVVNFINSLSVMCGIRLLRTFGIKESGHLLDALYHWWTKPWDKHTSHVSVHLKPIEKVDFIPPTVTERVIAQIDGVGWTRARALSRTFPTVEKLMGASAKDLQQVEGVGRVIANNIYEALR